MFDPKTIAELAGTLGVDHTKAEETKRDMLKLAQDVIFRDELLREGHDILNAVMLRSGLIFKLQEHAEIIAKVKAWNLRVREAGIIKIVSGQAG